MSVAHPESVALQKRFGSFPLATHETGETVLAAGSKTGRLLILRKGTVAVTRQGIEIARVAEPGAVFGEISALLDQPHSAVVRALETSQFHVAHATALQDPTALYHVAAVLARRLDGANEALVELKNQIRVGRPPKVIDETVEKIEGLLTLSATKSYLRRVPI